ncbi:NAD(P)H-flavin reductase [Candidatus Enterovibrio altilux]|nr:NAD(P)H-flavin reductase [Candidatus Enterovibrio luxaltus]
MNCQINAIIPLAKYIYKVKLRPDCCVAFKAGQYITTEIELKKKHFSIASSPFELDTLDLHIGSSILDESTVLMLNMFQDHFEKGKGIDIEGPYGNAWLRKENGRPILLIAGGTGISYTYCILKSCVLQKLLQPIHMYWGVKNYSLLYIHDELMDLSKQYNNIRYIPVLESFNKTKSYKTGTVLDVVMQEFNCLKNYDIYLCGSVEMIKSIHQNLCKEKKAQESQMYADAFDYL